ncbi:hypothetical protein NEF87_004521 [Candidatus Lokiarchaeum ossiferum]|uniref:Uncharacterized protein n=1 Tax=Candidatus Lokiarchaeum ossiferum TaxID=2951803 RepID=A0ABY6HXI1_9ARCH|nr:hypothetical protein NEF87_004521 [Candidatus Lokiarchaeum sp. B-35]
MSEEFTFYEVDIQEKRQLPYTITVEKVEGDIIFTHNQWGNSVRYQKVDDDYEILIDE